MENDINFSVQNDNFFLLYLKWELNIKKKE